MKIQTLAEQVLEHYEKGNSIRETAALLGIDKSKVQRILKSLQEKGLNTLNQQGETTENTLDTGAEFACDTGHEKRLMAQIPASNTVFDTVKPLNKPVSSYDKPTEQSEKSYSSAEVKQLFEQVNLFQSDYVPFINEMLKIHNGWHLIFVPQYRAHLTTINRLVMTAKFLAYQLNESHENLMVTQVLLSIKTTIENVLSGADPVKNEGGLLYLQNKVRSLQFWVDSVSGNFFDPAV